jgi:Protein of unknown function (DUF3142)
MYSARARLLFATFAFVLLSGASVSRRALPQDAYIWQRKWTPALRVALKQSSDLVRAWRVLAAYSDDGGRLQAVAVDWKALKSSGRPVIAVVRINGQLAHYNDEQLLSDLDGLLARWRQMGASVTGIEIDHDCGIARLAAYAKFLERVRASLDPSIPLSITALPAWLSSRELDAVFAPTSEVVLQVHMVQSPRAGLFDADQARRWIEEISRRTNKPFRVALPAYGVRVTRREDGSMLAVESEEPLLAGGYSSSELVVSPEKVAALLRDLERDPPATLTGIVWFRLPVAGDVRAWSPETWRAVVMGKPLRPRIEAIVEKSAIPGMNNIALINNGDVDGGLPQRIDLPASCTIADGINGYTLAHSHSGLSIERQQDGLLPGHQRRLIGWMRCTPAQVAIHAQR